MEYNIAIKRKNDTGTYDELMPVTNSENVKYEPKTVEEKVYFNSNNEINVKKALEETAKSGFMRTTYMNKITSNYFSFPEDPPMMITNKDKSYGIFRTWIQIKDTVPKYTQMKIADLALPTHFLGKNPKMYAGGMFISSNNKFISIDASLGIGDKIEIIAYPNEELLKGDYVLFNMPFVLTSTL